MRVGRVRISMFSWQCPALLLNKTEFDEGGWAGLNVVSTPFFKVPKMEYQRERINSESFKELPLFWGFMKGSKEPKLLVFLLLAGGAWTAVDIWTGL